MYLHPELGRALVADRVRDLEQARRGSAHVREVGRNARQAPAGVPAGDLLIRLAGPADAASLARLGALDGGTLAGERLAAAAMSADGSSPLVAEAGGELVAALDLRSGRGVADPFKRSAGALELLELRARQVRGAAAAPRRGVGAWLRLRPADRSWARSPLA